MVQRRYILYVGLRSPCVERAECPIRPPIRQIESSAAGCQAHFQTGSTMASPPETPHSELTSSSEGQSDGMSFEDLRTQVLHGLRTTGAVESLKVRRARTRCARRSGSYASARPGTTAGKIFARSASKGGGCWRDGRCLDAAAAAAAARPSGDQHDCRLPVPHGLPLHPIGAAT